MDIHNKTRKPLTIPLPGNKKLRLGPGKVGQITPRAAEHPAVRAMIEAGQVELLEGRSPRAAGGGSGAMPGPGPDLPGGIRHVGDR
jgi:hypothetical protein